MAFSAFHLSVVASRPGSSIEYSLMNSTGGELGTFMEPASSQHVSRCVISMRPCASIGCRSQAQNEPPTLHTAGSKRKVCPTNALPVRVDIMACRRRCGYGTEHADRTNLDGERLSQLSLPCCLRSKRRGAGGGST